MDHYLDITILSDHDFDPQTLLSTAFAKVHAALAARRCTTIGVSFPDHTDHTLGPRLRLHGTLDDMAAFANRAWLGGMRDQVRADIPRPVPPATSLSYRRVRRVQVKTSPERIRRRQMRRHGLSAAEARAQFPDSDARRCPLPFLPLHSTSTGQRFHLWIEHGPILTAPVPGQFSSYGLSPCATVPWF